MIALTIRKMLFTMMAVLSSWVMSAQEKSQSYYNSHENEILPDARAAFLDGNYERTLTLCRWHYIIVGDESALSLRKKADDCLELVNSIRTHQSRGELKKAKEQAEALLFLNPDDAYAKEILAFDPAYGIENGHDWIDLGLSVKWATCNIGADSPSECGDYYAWGELSAKSLYVAGEYAFRRIGPVFDKFLLEKYNTRIENGIKDDRISLELTDDVARINWGGLWRIPTNEELEELTRKCTWEWSSQNAMGGYVVTSTINGKSIFLPAAGSKYGAGLYNVGSTGFYWSSSLDTNFPYDAFGLSFDSKTVKWISIARYYGFPVRAVIQ